MNKWNGAIIVAAVALGVAGCVPEKHVVWSPDGRWAAVRGGDQALYLCDADGKLSNLIVAAVGDVAWLPDSERLVVTHFVKIPTWDELVRRLDAGTVARIEAAAQRARSELLAHVGDLDSFEPEVFEELTGGEVVAVLLCVRDKHNEGLRERLGEKWDELADIEGTVHLLRIGEVRDGTVELGRPLVAMLDGMGLCVSPDGRHLGFLGPLPSELARIMVIPVTGGPARIVAEETSAMFDWTPDGRHIAYTSTPTPDDGDGELCFGVVARREVVGADGTLLEEFPAAEELAGIVFKCETKVRCLPDGRIVFATLELELPCAADDMAERVGLYAIDPERQPTVTRLLTRQAALNVAEGLGWYEFSPDGKHVAFLLEEGQVTVITIASGRQWSLLGDDVPEGNMMLPSWRSNSELCLVARPGPKEADHRCEIVLVRLDWETCEDQRTILSADWPVEVVTDLLVGPSESDAQEPGESEQAEGEEAEAKAEE